LGRRNREQRAEEQKSGRKLRKLRKLKKFDIGLLLADTHYFDDAMQANHTFIAKQET